MLAAWRCMEVDGWRIGGQLAICRGHNLWRGGVAAIAA